MLLVSGLPSCGARGAAGGLADRAGVAAAHGLHIGERVVSKLPLVIVVLLFVDQDGLFWAGGGEADDARAAEGLSGLARAGTRAGRTVLPDELVPEVVLPVPPVLPLVPPLSPVVPEPPPEVPVEGVEPLPDPMRRRSRYRRRARLSRRLTTEGRSPPSSRCFRRGRCRRWGQCPRWSRRSRQAAGRRSPLRSGSCSGRTGPASSRLCRSWDRCISCAGSGFRWSSPARRRWADRHEICGNRAGRRGGIACRDGRSPVRGHAGWTWAMRGAATASEMTRSARKKMAASRM